MTYRVMIEGVRPDEYETKADLMQWLREDVAMADETRPYDVQQIAPDHVRVCFAMLADVCRGDPPDPYDIYAIDEGGLDANDVREALTIRYLCTWAELRPYERAYVCDYADVAKMTEAEINETIDDTASTRMLLGEMCSSFRALLSIKANDEGLTWTNFDVGLLNHWGGLVMEAYDNDGELWREWGLGGDDDVDYNGSYAMAAADILNRVTV